MRQVAVNKVWQRKGIGKMLVNFAEKLAKENGYKKIDLNSRITAVDFYLNLQYKKTGNEFTEVGIPHIKMFKIL